MKISAGCENAWRKIECLGSLPKNEEYANIYILAMRECLTNGVCHAGATELSITMQENDDFYRIRITNNGVAPEKEVVPKGGYITFPGIYLIIVGKCICNPCRILH